MHSCKVHEFVHSPAGPLTTVHTMRLDVLCSSPVGKPSGGGRGTPASSSTARPSSVTFSAQLLKNLTCDHAAATALWWAQMIEEG